MIRRLRFAAPRFALGLLLCSSGMGAGLLMPAATAGASPALGPPPGTGCGHSSCTVSLENLVKFSGNWSPHAHNPVDIPPPPCLWEPIGDTVTGSQFVISFAGPDPISLFGIDKSVAQAKQLLAEHPPPPGTWYELPVNPEASPAGQAECLKLPLFAWVRPGQLPPTVPIPPETLRALALAHMTVPRIGSVLVNPAGRSYTNLPTFVDVTLAGAATEVTGRGQHYSTVTASLPDGSLSVTVWAMAQPVSISAGTPDATVYGDGCAFLGSKASPGQMAHTGANQAIDCGVTYRHPGTGYALTAQIRWRVFWAITTGDGPGPLPPAASMAPLPNGNLDPITGTRVIPVAEIQSTNGG